MHGIYFQSPSSMNVHTYIFMYGIYFMLLVPAGGGRLWASLLALQPNRGDHFQPGLGCGLVASWAPGKSGRGGSWRIGHLSPVHFLSGTHHQPSSAMVAVKTPPPTRAPLINLRRTQDKNLLLAPPVSWTALKPLRNHFEGLPSPPFPLPGHCPGDGDSLCIQV